MGGKYKREPVVSIIIPSYNRAKLLSRAINSILNQTYENFELIIVDDGSIDNTKEIIRNFQKMDKRIKCIKHKTNKGATAARNTGIFNSKGKYIAFQDSDDEWFPNKLEKQMEIFKNADCDVGVVYTGFWKITDNKRTYIPQSWVKQKEEYVCEELLRGNFVGTPAMVIRKECFNKVGLFDEKLPRFQDWELAIRLSEHYRFKYINEPLFISLSPPDSISFNNKSLIKALKMILEKHNEKFQKHKKALSMHTYWIGSTLCKSGEVKEGRKYFLQAMKIFPFNIRACIGISVSLFGESFYNKIANINIRHRK